jgi:hypothetical protein
MNQTVHVKTILKCGFPNEEEKPVNNEHNLLIKLTQQLQLITILQALRNGLDCACKNFCLNAAHQRRKRGP